MAGALNLFYLFTGVLSCRGDGASFRFLSSDFLLYHHPLDGHWTVGVERHHAEAAVASKRRETLSTPGEKIIHLTLFGTIR